ncbi:hypothetical protein BH10PAT4_BH10PAT4_0120 [soil metagenome]
MARGFREENFKLPEEGPITPAEVASFTPEYRRNMANVARVLTGSSIEQSEITEDWTDFADPVTWKKPLTEGEL